MADHSKPTTTSLYSDFVTELDGRFDDLAQGLDPATTSPTNIPTNAIRWSSASNKWQKWNGTTWGDLSTGYAIPLAGPTTVVAASSSDALRITQTGTGNALVVEDSANPDSTPTVVTAAGDVGVGTASPSYKLDVAGTLHASGAVTLGDASTDTVTISGRLGFGTVPGTNTGIHYRATSAALTGGTNAWGLFMDAPFASDVTATSTGVYSRINTAAAAYTLITSMNFRAANANLGAGSSITGQYGLYIDDLTSATNNYGVFSLVSSGTNKYNIYAGGTAQNYFAGNVLLQTTTVAASTPGRLTLDTGANAGIDIFRSSSTANFIGIRFRDTTNANTYASIGWDVTSLRLNGDGGNVLLLTGGTERLRIDSSGNLGLGVAPSAWGTSSSARALELNAGSLLSFSTTEFNIQQNAFWNGTNWIYKASSAAVQYQQISGQHRWNIAPSGTAGNAITFTQAMTLTAAGELGIGTTSPAYTLHVRKDASGTSTYAQVQNGTATGAFGAGFLAVAGSSGYYTALTQSADGAASLTNANGTYLAFGTSNTERVRIDTNGQMRTTNVAGSVALAYDARAWVNFNGTGTVAIRASGNVTSITDNGTGDYTVNFTNAMSNANYAVNITAVRTAGGSNGTGGIYSTAYGTNPPTMTTSAVRICTGGGTDVDMSVVSVAVFA